MCFVRIVEETSIISLYVIKLICFCDLGGVCLLRGTDWVNIVQSNFRFSRAKQFIAWQ